MVMMSKNFGVLVLSTIASTLLADSVAAGDYGPQRRTLPESIKSVVSVPSAVSADICDKLAAQVTVQRGISVDLIVNDINLPSIFPLTDTLVDTNGTANELLLGEGTHVRAHHKLCSIYFR